LAQCLPAGAGATSRGAVRPASSRAGVEEKAPETPAQGVHSGAGLACRAVDSL